MQSKTFILWIVFSLAIHAVVMGLTHHSGPLRTEPGRIEIAMVRLLPGAIEEKDPGSFPETTERRSIAPTPLTNTSADIRPNRPQPAQHDPQNTRTELSPPTEEAAKQLPVNVAIKNRLIQKPSPVIESASKTTDTDYPKTAFVNRTPTIQAPLAANAGPLEPGVTFNPPDLKPLTAQRTPPRYLLNPPPLYPRLARERLWQGEVWLRVFVGEQGNVIDARVENSSGYPVLDKCALKTVRDWKFYPAQNATGRVREEVLVPIRFELSGA